MAKHRNVGMTERRNTKTKNTPKNPESQIVKTWNAQKNRNVGILKPGTHTQKKVQEEEVPKFPPFTHHFLKKSCLIRYWYYRLQKKTLQVTPHDQFMIVRVIKYEP